ncbi:MAG: hypothetical protein ACPGSN_00820, partial [Psychrobium sp.]
MDVVKSKKQAKINWSNKTLLAIGALVVVVLALWANQSASSVTVKRGEILIDQVKRGDLDVIIEGYGSLKSDKQQLITAFSRATVKEIVLKPGANVQADSVIVLLDNPELQQQLDSAKRGLSQEKANLRQLKLNQQREKLNEAAALAQINANYETASLKRVAEEKLEAAIDNQKDAIKERNKSLYDSQGFLEDAGKDTDDYTKKVNESIR